MNSKLENNQYNIEASAVLPIHGIQSQKRYESILKSLMCDGWKGVPLVKLDDDLLTGSHRWAVAKELGLLIPVVDVRDVFDLDDEDFNHAMDEDCWMLELTRLCWDVDAFLASELGMDIH